MDGMYQRDERVVYGSVGVCRVVDRQQRSFGGGTEEYYVLAPELSLIHISEPTRH